MVSAPAVHDGTIYIGAKNVYALSATDGTEQWRFVNHAPVSGMTGHRVPMESAPAVTDDTVYIGAGALDASSGEKLWGDLGNQEDSDYFVSVANENAAVEGPATAEDAVFMGMEYGSILRVDGGEPMNRRAFLAAGGIALGAGCSGLLGMRFEEAVEATSGVCHRPDRDARRGGMAERDRRDEKHALDTDSERSVAAAETRLDVHDGRVRGRPQTRRRERDRLRDELRRRSARRGRRRRESTVGERTCR